LPSLFECGGAVVLEAMAMGKPVIATHWGGPADYLDSSCGILVNPINYAGLVDGFASAMETLITDVDYAKSLGTAGREKAIRNFNWERKIDEMIGIYRTVIDNSGVHHKAFENKLTSDTATEH
jgi:glycosyltransferase involved in cell wall biosynthesis